MKHTIIGYYWVSLCRGFKIVEMESNQSLVCPELANQSLVCPVLAEPLVEEILTWLPVESLCRFRSVCQQWNALISSAKFITTQWAQAPPNRMPWLLVHNGKLGVAYCFYTGTWKKTSAISFSFVGDNHGVYSTAAGLLLLSDLPGCFTVCNPLTRSFIELPPMTSIRKIKTRVIVAGEGDHPETYKVVAMGLDNMNRGLVEIYDSTKKSWGIAPHRLPDLILYYIIARCEFVFCSGFFYCVGHCRGNWEIRGFSMTDEISISKDLPSLPRFLRICQGNKTYLAVCGSQLLVVVTTFQGGNLQQVIIWEFEKVNVNSSSSSSQLKLELKLKETVRMPSSLCESVNRFPTERPSPTIRCLGVKDCVCLRFFPYDRALKMITYNIREKTWTELPSVDFEDGYFTNVFEPRPDMKVQ